MKQAISTARAAGAGGDHVRGDSAFGTKRSSPPVWAKGSVLGGPDQDTRVNKAIATIADDAWTPVHYPGAVVDPDTGALISDAEVAETPYPLTSGAAAASSSGWWCAG